MYHFVPFMRESLILCLTFICFACNQPAGENKASDYAKLCTIYEETVNANSEPAMVGMQVSERVEKELPNVYVHYKNIVSADPKDAYSLFKKIAEKETNQPWDCKVMQDFYSGNLKK